MSEPFIPGIWLSAAMCFSCAAENRLGKQSLNHLSGKSRNWFIAATDIFHDADFDVAGMPDSHCQPSVVRTWKSIHTLSKPASITGKWDVHLITAPVMNSVELQNYSSVHLADVNGPKILGADADAVGTFGTITAVFVPSGTPWYGAELNALGTNHWADNIPIYPELDANVPGRIIAGGFEVHNVTAPMYKDGSVTIYDNGSDQQDILVNRVREVTAGNEGFGYFRVQRAPPKDVKTMAEHPSAITWDAAEGVYARLKLNLDQTDYSLQNKGCGMLFYGGSVCPGTTLTVPAVGSPAVNFPTRFCGVGSTIASFHGLSPESVLTLSTRIMTESAPTLTGSELALASPASPYDTEVLTLYRNVDCYLPCAVPVGMNPKGEWWGMVVKGLGHVVKLSAPLIAAIPEVGPVAARFAPVVGQKIVSKGQQLIDKSKEKEKAKAKTQGKKK
jgi:hypothetical protein